MNRISLFGVAPLVAVACASTADHASHGGSAIGTDTFNDLNLAAGSAVLYEANVRVANACDPDVGSPAQRAACATKVSPHVTYRVEGGSCPIFAQEQKIRLGTFDDMLEDHADYASGITLRYVSEATGANTLWLMPIFPSNDQWSLPDACDNLGSPYAVRDYMHASGTMSRRCIIAGADERSDAPCWGNTELETLFAQAHQRGLKIMLDVAMNHFGHNYEYYDYVSGTQIRDRVGRGESLDGLWNFDATYDDALVHPTLLDDPSQIATLRASGTDDAKLLAELTGKCPALQGDALVRAFDAYRVAFDYERPAFKCDQLFLEQVAPGFYCGQNNSLPATSVTDTFHSEWPDVKFLYHHEEQTAHTWEFARVREYVFRVLNYWSSRGVDGFRLDHTTDFYSGLGPNEWKYVLSKVDYYAHKRGQPTPIYLAEEFGDQGGMNHVVDIMTDGYVQDMCGRRGATKDAHFVEGVLTNNEHDNHAFVMRALETHDEARLISPDWDGTTTGFNMWTGAGFYGIGATARGTPMMLMGQELGEEPRLSFKRSDYLHARFDGSDSFQPESPDLVRYYQSLNVQRLRPENRALLSANYAFLRSRLSNDANPSIFAQVKWSDDGNVMFVFHNLWERDSSDEYYVDPGVAASLSLRDDVSYRLFDVLSQTPKDDGCRPGKDIRYSLPVHLGSGTRAVWYRLEECN